MNSYKIQPELGDLRVNIYTHAPTSVLHGFGPRAALIGKLRLEELAEGAEGPRSLRGRRCSM